MIPTKIRNRMFDRISGVTMRRFFNPITLANASGLAREVLLQSQKDFFVNGTITSHAACPRLMAGMWVGGREIALTNNQLPAWLKKAMGAALSEVNKCPYCEDMLLSLTHGAKENNVAVSLRENKVESITDELTRRRLQWTKASISRNAEELRNPPFSEEELPEALGTLVVFNYTNKISDFTMDGSPVPSALRNGALRLFGVELRESSAVDLKHGASLHLLPEATLPEEFRWAAGNPLVAESLSRWNRVVEEEIDLVLPREVQEMVRASVNAWEGGQAPLSRGWVEEETRTLRAQDRDMARLVLLIAKASYQVDDGVIEKVAQHEINEVDLVRLGSWAAFIGAKAAANWSARAASKARTSK